MKTIFACTTMAMLLFSACNSSETAETTRQGSAAETTLPAEESSVPFIEARNYFVKNTYGDEAPSTIKITSQAAFDSIFGMAATMSANSKPTPIDFSKQYVIGYVGKATNKTTELAVGSLSKKGNEIILSYTQLEGNKQSFTSRPFLLLIVDNTYNGELKAERIVTQ
ncbi:MAG: hypothetical protein ACTHLE_14370 [Agriterribacter sp.]